MENNQKYDTLLIEAYHNGFNDGSNGKFNTPNPPYRRAYDIGFYDGIITGKIQTTNNDELLLILKNEIEQNFKKYLIDVGIRSNEYAYSNDTIMENINYFRDCYDSNLSAYKALLFLTDFLNENKTKIN